MSNNNDNPSGNHLATDKKKILKELTEKQLKNIPVDRKLHFKDLRRITKYINTSIFDSENCCMWNGYVTNETNSKRGTYVNFFFRKKKVALHRLLYENFVGMLGDDSYLKFNCDESDSCGKCCNVQHMVKCTYNGAEECAMTAPDKKKKSKSVAANVNAAAINNGTVKVVATTTSMTSAHSNINASLKISFD